MSAVQDLVRQVEEAGCTITVAGDRLRLQGPAPLPGELLEEIRRHKPEIIHTLTHQRDGDGEDARPPLALALADGRLLYTFPAPQGRPMTTEAVELLGRLQAAGIGLVRDGTKLLVIARRGRIRDADLSAIVGVAGELVTALNDAHRRCCVMSQEETLA